MHHVSDAPKRAVATQDGENGPSIVISPHAEEPAPRSPSRRKGTAEPTLVIRDKRQVQELRNGVRRIARRKARQRLGSILLWGGASALAFGFGTAVAFFLATAGKAPSPPVDEAPSAASAGAREQDERLAAGEVAASHGRQGQRGSKVGSAKDEPAGVVSLSELPDATASSGAEDRSDPEDRKEAQATTGSQVISLEDL